MKRTFTIMLLLLVLVMLNTGFVSFAERKGDVPVIYSIKSVTLSQDDFRIPDTFNSLFLK